MSTTVIEVLVILALILANGLFAMAELALISARKNRLEQSAEGGDRRAVTALEMAANPNKFLSTVQVGITLIGILSGAFGGATLTRELSKWIAGVAWLAPYSDALALIAVVLLITYFSLVIGELIPKRLAMNNPENTALRLAGSMRFLSRIFSPLIRFLSGSTELGLRLLRVQSKHEPAVTEDDVRTMLEQGTQSGVFEESEEGMVKSVFRLSDRRINSLMTPRTEIAWLDVEEPFEQELIDAMQSGHSRFPVAHGDLDRLVGILSIKKLIMHNLNRGQGICLPQSHEIYELLETPLFTPENTLALRVLEEMKQSGKHLAMVIDEYGGVTGMVTLMDLLGAVVSEIPGNGSSDKPQAIQRPDGSWLVDGLLDIDDFKQLFVLDNLPREERAGFQTVGGFVVTQLGSIPSAGQIFTWESYKFEILDMDGYRVDKVLITRINPEHPEESISN